MGVSGFSEPPKRGEGEVNLSQPTGAKQILTMAALGLWHAVAAHTQQGVMQLQNLRIFSGIEVMSVTLKFDLHIVSVVACAI